MPTATTTASSATTCPEANPTGQEESQLQTKIISLSQAVSMLTIPLIPYSMLPVEVKGWASELLAYRRILYIHTYMQNNK